MEAAPTGACDAAVEADVAEEAAGSVAVATAVVVMEAEAVAA
jgi:hypothetical protein